ncbi:Cation/H(+) antiporter 19 [Apostasia shenzhenica]|uniref:Cation/H(+) antiporter 19 n=1 Tax=Apostasia shenzhenica TaxID=1088818 RepID=A0A2I0A7I6_9ASPA|nr:Cation/H(+) antiporter 19 [Apostasia shenzhenica]
MALFTTFITTPFLTAVYKPARRSAPYKHRTIERPAGAADTELRILACFHGSRRIPSLITLIESSRGTRRRGLTVYAMHLMELSERSSAISTVHRARLNGLPFSSHGRRASAAPDDHVVVAFEAYRQLSRVSVRPMTAISDLRTIHDDIIASAQQKRVAIIVLPFHKVQRLDGSFECLGAAHRLLNLRILCHSPCSVAVLVDRGLEGAGQVSSSDFSLTVAILFFGGPDDREDLAYGARMAEHPGIAVTLFRFFSVSAGKEDLSDTASVEHFRSKTATMESAKFVEMVVGEQAEVVAAIKSVGSFNLFLVGRRAATAALAERTCSKLRY